MSSEQNPGVSGHHKESNKPTVYCERNFESVFDVSGWGHASGYFKYRMRPFWL